MDGRPLDGFLDRKRLQDGDSLQASFIDAMATTSVVVPIVSASALRRMASLAADSPCDNVLLEWSFALELHAQRGVRVFPLFVGTERLRSSQRARPRSSRPSTASRPQRARNPREENGPWENKRGRGQNPQEEKGPKKERPKGTQEGKGGKRNGRGHRS